jgi:hypothetical protein
MIETGIISLIGRYVAFYKSNMVKKLIRYPFENDYIII